MSSETGDSNPAALRGLSVVDVHRSFGLTRALAGVSFNVAPEEIVALLGPSGCGKSTLLSVVAGLIDADQGSVAWNGQPLTNVPPHRRGFGLMFQDLALFPHLNVFHNIAYGLRAQEEKQLPEEEIRARVEKLLYWVGMAGYADREVETLSGGEQQRVALARALAPRPRLLMLDEPLGALDRILRERLLSELATLLRRLRQTAIYVTHDQEEAFALADRVVVMQAGRVAQIGTPSDIYRRPASTFVARFLGMNNILRADGTLDGIAIPEEIRAMLPAAGEGHILIRPDAARLGDGGRLLAGRLEEVSFRGPTSRVVVSVGSTRLTFDLPAESELPAPGSTVHLSLDPDRAFQRLP
ncbi:MAG TPA: ABC transporter ATP-binding protein [Anaerolineales bacterium]|nr:ABC transporter ATP-binding protein [Anaerolineales bacterium]